MRPDPAALDDLLGSLADGTPIDWAALEAEARDEPTRRRFRNLRLVARVAELHRSQPLEPDPGVTPIAASDGAESPASWGPLRVGKRLASGADGAVYRAHDPSLDRDVALKLLRTRADGADTTRLLTEAQALARVAHQNVVIVHGADVHEGQPGLWMELIDGQTLAALTGARGRLGAAETIAIGRDVCRALSAIHAAGLVHGDVKAQNVMRESGGRIVLMDFGAGRRLGAAQAAAGTPMYLAPEVLAGGPPTPQADLYSLGVLMFTSLSGRYPYEADDLDALRRAHADGARVYLRDLRPDLPDTLVDTVERALESDPARRFPSGGAMERALAGAQQLQPAWWRGLVVAALVAAALVAGVALIWWPRAPRSLAVLTFSSSGEEAAYLIDGLNKDLIRELQRYDVQVRTDAGARGIASSPDLDARLHADAIISGSTTRVPSGSLLTVAVRRSGSSPFWRQDYDVVMTGVPALAATIAGDVGAVLGIRLRENAPVLYQANPRAYDAYQRGRVQAERRTPTDLAQSLAYFKLAASLDSGFAEPWVGISDVTLTLGIPPFGSLRPQEARVPARQALERALAINPALAEAETSRAFAAVNYDWDWAGAETGYLRAISLNSQYALAHHWYAMLLTDLGRFDDAMAELTRAQALQPLSALIQRDFGWIHFMAGRYDDAIRSLRQVLSTDPGYGAATTLLARSLAAAGQFDAALAELERLRPEHIGRNGYLSFRGHIEAAAGHPRARQTLDELRALAQREYVTPYYFALIYTALGQHDEAIAELQRAHSEQDTTITSINVDPRFASLRSDSRFQAIVSSMRFPAPRR